jgi:hypothetical protein
MTDDEAMKFEVDEWDLSLDSKFCVFNNVPQILTMFRVFKQGMFWCNEFLFQCICKIRHNAHS